MPDKIRARVLADVECFDGRDGFGDEASTLLGVEWRIGRKQTTCRAEVIVAATRRGHVAVQRGIGIKHVEIVVRRPLERLGARIAVRRAKENLLEPERDTAGEIGNHAAHVVRNDLQFWHFVE